MTHHLNLNPFNNRRRSVHKARSTPCFLLLSLPWRSSNEMVPPPPAFRCRGHTHAQAHTLRCLSVIIFPREPKGHCDDHELEWNPSVPSPFIQSPPPPRKTHINPRVALLCPKSHKRAPMTAEGTCSRCVEAARGNGNHLMIPFSSTKQNDSLLWLITPLYRHTCARKHTHALVKCDKRNFVHAHEDLNMAAQMS